MDSAGGKVCVHYNGETFYSTFALDALQGNRGVDSLNRTGSPFWIELELAKIVKLHKETHAEGASAAPQ